MKLITFLLMMFFVVLLTSCEEQISKGKELSQDERDFLRLRASAKCISSSNKTYENIEELSNENILDFERGKTFKYEFKKDDVVVETSYLYVWKVSSPFIYFRLAINESGTLSNKFIKLDTATNIDMFRNLQVKNCNKDLTVTGTSTLTTKIEELKIRVDSETRTQEVVSYTISPAYPAYFGALNKLRTKTTYDNNDKITKTEKFNYVISSNAETVQPEDYADATIVNKSYCVVKYVDPNPPVTLNAYSFPWQLECTSSDITGPDANGDAQVDFDPAIELVI